jgi:hypothetical protein
MNGEIETFDDALRAAQEQMAMPEGVPADAQAAAVQTAGIDSGAGQGQNPPPEPEPGPGPQPEAQPAAGPDPQTMQIMAQIERQNQQLVQQNAQLQNMLAEISNKNQAGIVEEALTPPVLDLSGLWSEDDNVVAQKQAEYAQRMAEFTEKKLMSQLSPLLENAKQGMAERERREALTGLSQVPELAGIMGMTPTLEKIIESNPALSGANVSIEDKLITAYAIAKGAEAIKNGLQKPVPQAQPGVEDFIKMYSQNPDLQKRVEQIRASRAAQSVADVPPMSASSGVFNAALTAQEKPKDFEEAKRLAFARLGI